MTYRNNKQVFPLYKATPHCPVSLRQHTDESVSQSLKVQTQNARASLIYFCNVFSTSASFYEL